MLPAVGFTQERQAIYDFSKNPVYIDSGVLFASKKLALHTVFDLEGKKVAGVRGSIFTTGFVDYMKSFAKWTMPPPSTGLPPWLLWGGLGSIIFALFLGAWNISLNKQVALKTKHLRKQIAERNQAEEEIRRLNAELESRVAARTEELRNANGEMEAFTYSVAHNLSSPPRSINGLWMNSSREYWPCPR